MSIPTTVTAIRTEPRQTQKEQPWQSEPRRQQISELMAQNPQMCLVMAKKVTQKLIESHLVEGSFMRCKEIARPHSTPRTTFEPVSCL